MGFLTSYYIEGYTPGESLLRGQIVARHTCTIRASIMGLMTKAELDKRYHELRDKYLG